MKARPILLGGAFLLLSCSPALAYVGPGAGFAVAPLLWGLFIGLFVILLVLALPFLLAARLFSRYVLGRKPPVGKAKRVVVVGFDGLDPGLLRRYIKKGLLPNFAALESEGDFSPLDISIPSISPSSWSTFMTGADASRHNIYDFLTRDPCTYLPMLSSTRIEEAKRVLPLGKYRYPLGRPVVKLLRKSKPFWKVLSERRIFSSILRVPITFPPDKFNGVMLSGMCVPDLKGTQGTFSFFTTGEPEDVGEPGMGYGGDDCQGVVTRVVLDGDVVRGEITGPKNTIVEGAAAATLPFTARIDRAKGKVRLIVGKTKLDLSPETFSGWVRLEFRLAPAVKVAGIVRFRLISLEPEFGLYMTPIHIDPEKPVLPISHPFVYSVYLARKDGPFATLGLAEDTWALNERILDEQGFLDQVWLNHEEREKHLFTALKTTRSGCVTVVFDTSDRIQHMFFRYLFPDHPANAGKDVTVHRNAIRDMYVRLDGLVGRLRKKLMPDDDLIVLSDHGFCSFKRGVNLNTWLHQEGYLTLEEGRDTCGDWFEGVDWKKTKAFSLGLTGMFLNRLGRESEGIVSEGEEARALKDEIIGKLTRLTDPKDGRSVIREVYDAEKIYDGPYRDDAPDLMIGYERGYRNSWEGAVGRVTDEAITDNTKSWSGDHCVDPKVVPGVLFTSRKLPRRRPLPKMEDLAPTILDLLGVEKPGYMTGEALFGEGRKA